MVEEMEAHKRRPRVESVRNRGRISTGLSNMEGEHHKSDLRKGRWTIEKNKQIHFEAAK